MTNKKGSITIYEDDDGVIKVNGSVEVAEEAISLAIQGLVELSYGYGFKQSELITLFKYSWKQNMKNLKDKK